MRPLSEKLVAPGDDDAGNASGAAYIFERNGTIWIQQAKLTARDAKTSDRFGISVSINGEGIIVGAPGRSDTNGDPPGSAYVFVRSGTVWTQQVKLTATDATEDDLFGNSVAISKDIAIVGAFANDGAGKDSGAAYIYQEFALRSVVPIITAVSPSSGPTSGGTPITIMGKNFVDGMTVTIGGPAVTALEFVSATQLTVRTPAGNAGSANIVVTNPDGQSATSAGGFTYISPIQVISPILSSVGTDKDQVVALGIEEATITITVRDDSGKPISEQSITISVTGEGNTITQPQIPTDANGITMAKIRSTKAELKTVTVTVGEKKQTPFREREKSSLKQTM